MALENLTNTINPLNNNAIWNNLPPEILTPFTKLITILKIAGVVVLIYILFLLIKGILTWKRNRKINQIYEKVMEIDKKLEKLLNKPKEKEKIHEKEKILEKQKTKSNFFNKLFKKEKPKKEIKEEEKKIKEKPKKK